MARFLCFLSIFILGALVLQGCTEQTGRFVWGPPNAESVQAVLQSEKDFTASPWARQDWHPQGWLDSRGGSAKTVIEGFYEAGIVTDQYFDKGTPVLEVGQKFLELSREDKHNVTAFIDETFGITRQQGAIKLVFYKYDLPVGIFTAQGLQLQ